MDLVEALAARLDQIVGISDVVDDRIYGLILPQGVLFPAIRLQILERDDPMHLRGTVGFVTSRVQIDYYARRSSGGDPLQTVRALAAAAHGTFENGVATGLAGWAGDIGSPPFRVALIRLADEREEFVAEELNEARISQDYFVKWYQP